MRSLVARVRAWVLVLVQVAYLEPHDRQAEVGADCQAMSLRHEPCRVGTA